MANLKNFNHLGQKWGYPEEAWSFSSDEASENKGNSTLIVLYDAAAWKYNKCKGEKYDEAKNDGWHIIHGQNLL